MNTKMKVSNDDVTNYMAITELVDELDTDKIVKVMELLNWEWYCPCGHHPCGSSPSPSMAIPTAAHIRRTARDLLKTAVEGACKRQRILRTKSESFFVATGGLEAEAIAYDDDVVVATIRFVLNTVDNNEE